MAKSALLENGNYGCSLPIRGLHTFFKLALIFHLLLQMLLRGPEDLREHRHQPQARQGQAHTDGLHGIPLAHGSLCLRGAHW